MNAVIHHPSHAVGREPVDRLARPLRDLRLSVIEACNFRCPYCMPADRVPDDYGFDAASRLSFDEIETLVRGFVRLGVSKLRLTGGEPLLRRNLPELVARLAAIEGLADIALTTNGSLLARHAQALRTAGLGRITVSLDAIDPQVFAAMSGGRGEIGEVLAGIDAAREAGFAPIKLNCVVQRGVNDDQVLPLLDYARGRGHVLRFIEFMDVGTCNGWRREGVVPSAELRDRIHARWPLRSLDPNYRGEVASRYAFVEGAGEVGFVSSVTEPFCGNCHRARVSADGALYTCLFAGEGRNLRPLLAQGERALTEHVAQLWERRSDRYSELRSEATPLRKKVEMFLVGG
jgi:cyclic pyranopterin phosphate synthase